MGKAYVVVMMLVSITSVVLNGGQVKAQVATEPFYFYHICVSTQGNYSGNSTYESNLKTVLSDLKTHASSEIFYNSSAGSESNTVYGQYFCRGDVNATLCGACIESAVASLFSNCSLIKGGIMWYEQCTLRYSNISMVGIEAVYPRSWINATVNVADPEALASVLDTTINKMIEEATEGNTPSLFATEEGVVSAFETVYCLMQCSPDLNATQCDTCLRSTYAFIPTCCVGMSKQVAIFYASCQLRYTTYGAFYSGATSTTTPPTSATPPPPPRLPGSGSTTVSPPPPTNTTFTNGASKGLTCGIMRTATLAILLMVIART